MHPHAQCSSISGPYRVVGSLSLDSSMMAGGIFLTKSRTVIDVICTWNHGELQLGNAYRLSIEIGAVSQPSSTAPVKGAVPSMEHTCNAVFHLPNVLTLTASWASAEDAAAHSLSADMEISRLIMMATGRAMVPGPIGNGGEVVSSTRAVATMILSATAARIG